MNFLPVLFYNALLNFSFRCLIKNFKNIVVVIKRGNLGNP